MTNAVQQPGKVGYSDLTSKPPVPQRSKPDNVTRSAAHCHPVIRPRMDLTLLSCQVSIRQS